MIKTIEFKGASCFYNVEGKGNAVMLVHGFVEEASMWNGILKALSKRYKVIAPDLPGFGQSPMTKGKLSMETYAEFLHEILEKEKVKQCVLIGHSMGGYAALHFVEKYPSLLKGFGLINSHCFEDSAEKKANRKKGNEFIAKHGTKAFVNEIYNNLFHSSFKKKNQKLIKGMIADAEKYSPEALIAANTAMMSRKDKSHVLTKTKVPVLLISGKQDETVPLEYSLKQASLAAVTDFHLLDKTKHMSFVEKKKETIAAIGNFIELCY